MAIQSFFPTYIEHSKNVLSPAKNLELKKEIYQIQKIDHEGASWSEENYFGGYTSYGSMDQLHLSSPRFAELAQVIAISVQKFVKFSEWDIRAKDLKMNSCWVNIMPQGTHHSFHIHPHSVLSGTYYVEVPQDSSPIKFEDPRLPQLMLAPIKKPNAKLINQSFISLSSASRELILFESWLRHEVPANRSKKSRISVSFNYSF